MRLVASRFREQAAGLDLLCGKNAFELGE